MFGAVLLPIRTAAGESMVLFVSNESKLNECFIKKKLKLRQQIKGAIVVLLRISFKF